VLRERRFPSLEVHLDGKAVYSSAFAICQSRRSEIQPEPQQRILEFRFDAEPKRFPRQDKAEERSSSRQHLGAVGNEMHTAGRLIRHRAAGSASTRFTWLERILHLGLSGSAVS